MKVIVSAGGTGGHIYPALAIINKLKEKHRNCEVLYIGTTDRMEATLVPSLGIKYKGIPMKGLNRKNIFKNVSVLKSFNAAINRAKEIISEFKPDIVLGIGGYITAPVILAAHKLGVKKIVVHSGSCAKMPREVALELAKDTLTKAQARLDELGLSEIIIFPETMGKINQLGTLSEVMELCKVDERFLPCVDFGHLNARTLGGIKSIEDYSAMLYEIENKLGFERLKNFHVHFSKIQYTSGGEKCHLTFDDNEYGPDFEPLMELFAKRNLEPSVICESAGTQAEDASMMKKAYESYKS